MGSTRQTEQSIQFFGRFGPEGWDVELDRMHDRMFVPIVCVLCDCVRGVGRDTVTDRIEV